jgi:hypothetical protein
MTSGPDQLACLLDRKVGQALPRITQERYAELTQHACATDLFLWKIGREHRVSRFFARNEAGQPICLVRLIARPGVEAGELIAGFVGEDERVR